MFSCCHQLFGDRFSTEPVTIRITSNENVYYVILCSANNNALKAKRKTITLNDVYSALEDMEFEDFVDPLQAQLAGIY